MKRFIYLISALLFSLLLVLIVNVSNFNINNIISPQVLAKATPINVRIDLDLLRSLGPAYE